MVRLWVSVIALFLLATACSGSEQDQSTSRTDELPLAPTQSISDGDLEALLPALSDLPAGWVRSQSDDEGSIKLCDRIEALGSIDDLGLPTLTVEYESANGALFRDAGIAVFGRRADATDRVRQFIAALSEAECQTLSFESNDVKLDAVFRETSTGNPDVAGRLATITLGESLEGFDEGSVVIQVLSAAIVVGRCSIGVTLTDATIIPTAPSEFEIDDWISPIIDAANRFRPCDEPTS